jgi:hypothetical protein
MNEYLNGEGLSCDELKAELCDNCLRSSDEGVRDKRRRESEEEEIAVTKVRKLEARGLEVKERSRDDAKLRELIEWHMNMSRKYCGVCWVDEGWQPGDHTAEECNYLKGKVDGDYKKWKEINIK